MRETVERLLEAAGIPALALNKSDVQTLYYCYAVYRIDGDHPREIIYSLGRPSMLPLCDYSAGYIRGTFGHVRELCR